MNFLQPEVQDILDLEEWAAHRTYHRERNPARRKWLDAKQARHQLQYGRGRFGRKPSRPDFNSENPHALWNGFSKNGIPFSYYYHIRHSRGFLSDTPQSYFMSGFNRPRFLKEMRRKNGKVEHYGWGDAWSKPFHIGKSSRQYERMKKEWWAEAYEE